MLEGAGAGAGAFWWSLGEGKGRGLEGVDQEGGREGRREFVRVEKKGGGGCGGCDGCGDEAIM